MVFGVTKTSDWNYKGQVTINSLEELKLFMEFNQKDIIIHRPNPMTYDHTNYEINICDGDWE